MATGYFPQGNLDSPASDDDIAHLEETLGLTLPPDLAALWRTTATYNGHLLMADGSEGPYFKLFHPSTALERSKAAAVAKVSPAVVFGASEEWDYAVIAEKPARWVDLDRESGEVLSELGDTFEQFVDSLRREHAAEDDLFN